MCNYTQLGAQVGLDSKTAARYVGVFEQMYLLQRVNVWARNRLSRVVKTPKLQFIDYVIHMDPWWNPAVEDQASDRAHRIGQTRPVTIYRLVAKDTIEEKIVDLHKTKRALADSLLEGSDMAAKMSADDMLQLLQDEWGAQRA